MLTPHSRSRRSCSPPGADFLADAHPLFQRRLRQDHHELVAAVAGHGGVALLHDALQQEADLAQDLAAGQMAMAIVDDLEVVEVHEQQHRFLAAGARIGQRFVEADVEPAVVVQPGQIVFLGQLVCALGVERVLQGEGRVAGEDLQQRHVALGEALPLQPVDQLQHAAEFLPM